ncbi:hypothetical protein [Sanyastnella coralliicola]|uniref:hypothetical protein n=1 Tax=Sanyastnella coralliicola TaxID=3069118 RepID=UPI0027B8A2C4|nr:hypothetical protein [Longitalea sp. SCSIO 12813]
MFKSRLLFLMLFCVSVFTSQAQTIKWECQDTCVNEDEDLLCGTTDHFKPVMPNGEGINTFTELSDGSFLLITEGSGNGGSEQNVTIQKLTSQGEPLWSNKVFSTSSITVADVAEDLNGNIILVGSYAGNAFSEDGLFDSLAEGQTDSFTLNYQSNGGFNWGASIGAAGVDRAQQVTTDNEGNIIVAGTFSGEVNFNTDDGGDVINLVYVLSDGYGSAFKLDPNGNTQWATVVDLYEELEFTDMDTDQDGNTVFSGKYCSNVGLENPIFVGCDGTHNNVLAGMINPNGGNTWIGSIESDSPISLRSMHVSGNGLIYLMGGYQGLVDFDLGPEVQEYNSEGGADLFVVGYDANGTLVEPLTLSWADGDAIAEGLSEDENGNMLLTYASALSPQADLLCANPNEECVNEMIVGLMTFTSAMNGGQATVSPIWSNTVTRKGGGDWNCTMQGGAIVCTCQCLSASINTGGGPLDINAADSEPFALLFGIEQEGCTDPNACNYDASATISDGKCLYSETCAECGGDGECIGCTDVNACNYAPTAYISDTCTFPDGCTDPMAINYNEGASCDDGTCVYQDELCGECTVWDEEQGKCIEDPACAASCFGDANNDGVIGGADLLAFLAAFGGVCE